jgi:hypothetical protein
MLQLEAARLIPYDPAKMATRIYGLTNYLVQHRDERSTAYLSRLAKCYMLEMRTEFTVMARAVLDAALQEAVDDAEVRATVGAEREVTLERRIAHFSASGVFSRGVEQAARDVKKAGDDAVHAVPGLEPNPDDTLRKLVAVFEALDAGPQSSFPGELGPVRDA